MVEHGGANRDAVTQNQPVAGAKVVILDLRSEGFQRHREQRCGHQATERLLQGHRRQQVAGPDAELVARNESREKEREAFDMIQVSVGEQNIEFIDTRMNANLLRQIAQKTGGRYFSSNDLSGLPEALRAAPQYEPEDTIIKSDIQLWNLIWLLGAAILAFAIEWFLRKQSGMI